MKQSIFTYLMLKDAKSALDYYKNVFNASIEGVYTKDSIPNIPYNENNKNIVIHAGVKIENVMFFACEEVTDNEGLLFNNTKVGNNVAILIMYSTLEQLQTVYNNLLKHGCNIIKPLQVGYWGGNFATVTDKYNVTWCLEYVDPSIEPK